MRAFVKVLSFVLVGSLFGLGAGNSFAQSIDSTDPLAGDRPSANPARPADASSARPDVASDWMQLCQAISDGAIKKIGQSPDTAPSIAPTTAPAGNRSYVPWKDRYGPAYPGDFWTSMGRDGKETPLVLWDDTKAIATNPVSLVGLVAATATGIALNNTKADSSVEHYYRKHGSELNSFWDTVGDAGGNPGTHFAIAGVAYVLTLATGDTKNYEAVKSLASALIINGILTEGIKVAAQTRSPNGDPLAFPSGHTSSIFTMSTVVAEYYGPLAGAPMYAFATFVGYERIDSGKHQFSDVISGALIGMAIGHGVVQNHKARETRVLGMDVVPYIDPDRDAVGVALVKNW